MLGCDEIERRFTYHPPKDGQSEIYEGVRRMARELASYADTVVPDGREKSLAITKLEEFVMWANAGVARRWAHGTPCD